MNIFFLTGFCQIQATIKDGERMGTARAFLRPFLNRPNLQISINTMVIKVLIMCLYLFIYETGREHVISV